MDVTEAIRTRLSAREYTDRPVDRETQTSILESARLTQSGHNSQHWRFVVLDDDSRLADLASRTLTGSWLEDAAFAVVVCTDPERPYNEIDAGRVVTTMQLEAWEREIGSCICTGFDDEAIHSYLGIPDSRAISAIIGFGHPPLDVDSLTGRKDRLSLESVAFRGSFGESL